MRHTSTSSDTSATGNTTGPVTVVPARLPCPPVRAGVTATIYPSSRHGAARVQDRRIGARSKET